MGLKELAERFNISEKQAAFAIVSHVTNEKEAARIVLGFSNSSDFDISRKIKAIEKTAPGITAVKRFLNNCIQLRGSIVDKWDDNKKYFLTSKDNKSKENEKRHITRDEIVTELEIIANEVKGKDRAQVLMKLADFSGLSKEESDPARLVHFYLPASCRNCPARIAAERDGAGGVSILVD